MEKAVFLVGIIEDSEDVREISRLVLGLSGYEVPDSAVARNKQEALTLVEALRLGDIALHAVLLDANLTESNSSGSDGSQIADELLKLPNPPVIVGFSAYPPSMS